jgi:hypothetical protein
MVRCVVFMAPESPALAIILWLTDGRTRLQGVLPRRAPPRRQSPEDVSRVRRAHARRSVPVGPPRLTRLTLYPLSASVRVDRVPRPMPSAMPDGVATLAGTGLGQSHGSVLRSTAPLEVLARMRGGTAALAHAAVDLSEGSLIWTR